MKNIIFIFFLFLFGNIYSQIYEDTICWVWVNDAQYEAKQGVDFSDKSDLNTILNSNQVVYYEKALPFATTSELHKIHEIRCNSNGHIDNVINSLSSSFSGKFDRFSKFEVHDPVYVYDPIDWMWTAHADDWLWHLKRIQADYAWDIERGDPNIKIAIIDYDFDVTHPDLATEIDPHYDPYSLYQYDCIVAGSSDWHGTTVASFASAETTEQGGTAQGQLASVGFNTKIIGYMSTPSRQTNLAKALHACNVMGADVMVSCAGYGSLSCYPDPNSGEELIIKEILDNGMSIVMPAGNGPYSTSCGPAGDQHAFYPFNPEYDDRIIIVTSTDFDDYHYWEDGSGVEHTHSHFPEVDICSPGYDIMGAATTECGGNTWPYYGSYGGTSFSSPIVAGAVSLLKSVNENFTPGEIQEFIKRTADPVIDAQNYQGLIGAGRLNIYGAVDLAVNCTTEVITGIETWNDDKVILCGLVIEDGGELTIHSTVEFAQNSNVIVKPGGKLFLDSGCTLTSLDNIFWPGIEVWGDPTSSSQFDQGLLTIKNGALIENADVAIRNHHYDLGPIPPDNHQGGITKAYNSTFKNNKLTMDFRNYSYNSYNYIKNCDFIYNDDFLGTSNPGYFIESRYMTGITVYSCDFYNNTSTLYNGSGIYSYKSNIYVKGKCISQTQPCTQWENSNFNNLVYGVYAMDNAAGKYIDIRNTTFNLCQKSVYISGMDGARVTSNEFVLPISYQFDIQKYGLYLNNSNAYHVEDNDFIGPSPTQKGAIGVYANNSGTSWNQVYNNRFENIKKATVANGINRDDIEEIGLCIKCNDYQYNDYDIFVNGKPNVSNHGISPYQGSFMSCDTCPAGNTFSGSATVNLYNSDGMGYFTYIYHYDDGGVINILPVSYYSGWTMGLAPNFGPIYIKELSCPSKLESSGHIEEERDGMANAESNTGLKEAQLSAWVDDGDTEGLNFDVLLSSPPEAGVVYQDLMDQAPFISDTVLKTAIYKEDVLINAMIRDILLASPQSAKNDEILKAIDERFDPMPQWMIDQVLEGVNILSAKEAVEAEISAWKNTRSEHFNNLYQFFRKDTIDPYTMDSLEILLVNDSYLESKYRLAFLYYQKQEYGNMNTVLNNIPSSFELSATEQSIHQDYLVLFNVLGQLSGNELLINESHAAQLETLIERDGFFPGAYARDILFAAGFINYEEPINIPEILKSSEAIEDDKHIFGKPEVLNVFPNPANDYIIVDYNTEGHNGIVLLSIIDLNGKPVFAEVQNETRNQKVISTINWKSGVYLVTVSVNGSTIRSSKLTVK